MMVGSATVKGTAFLLPWVGRKRGLPYTPQQYHPCYTLDFYVETGVLVWEVLVKSSYEIIANNICKVYSRSYLSNAHTSTPHKETVAQQALI